MSNQVKIAKLKEKINQLDAYVHDSIEDYRKGEIINQKRVGVAISCADKMRATVIKLGGNTGRESGFIR